ncbi:hypothetical protein [Nostoc sp. CMAA1605]|uniref:hypothetical protein n=1 Tax=Nostoc sp. CMAA1605 TaxID=2055159 RepID=UPI001F3C3834|nr:hypothetical protein [Nostoc sp. CMAA1605]MCF4965792.1 hypothetical protein [Nostoc sp. CMAA1605]
MLFEFTPSIKASLEAGKYVEILSNGISIGIVRDTADEGLFAPAIGALVDSCPLSPLTVPIQLLMTGAILGANIVQKHQAFYARNQQNILLQTGLQSLRINVEVLQTTTAMIELSKTSNVALEAVNLQHILKLKQEVEQVRLEVKDGLIDLQQAFKYQGIEVRQIVKEVAENIEFDKHRLVLVKAYTLLLKALNLLHSALKLRDSHQRNAEIDSAREILLEVLAYYMSPQLLEQTSAPGQLRRLECAWAVEQAIVITYQLQNEMVAVSDRLSHLRDQIKEHTCTVISNCESYDELNFLFPEISRICKHDLAILEIWQARIDWIRSLTAKELELLASNNSNSSEFTECWNSNQSATDKSLPPEQIAYEDLAEKSHFYSLLDQLIFMFKPVLRQEYEVYINQQAHVTGHKILVPKNLQQASHLTVANLYYYFKVRDETNTEETLETIIA